MKFMGIDRSAGPDWSAYVEGELTDGVFKIDRVLFVPPIFTKDQEPLGPDFEAVWDANVDKLYQD